MLPVNTPPDTTTAWVEDFVHVKQEVDLGPKKLNPLDRSMPLPGPNYDLSMLHTKVHGLRGLQWTLNTAEETTANTDNTSLLCK